jgi:DNA-damage-inducible protein J
MATTAVTAIVDERLNHEASVVLAELGLTVEDALRILLAQVVQEHTFPLAMHIPNAETIEAMQEADRGEGKRYESLSELFRDMREKPEC